MFRKLGIAVLAALLLGMPAAGLARAESAAEIERRTKLELLYERLATADEASWERLQDQIFALWTQSGSDTADLLLARARTAMEAEDYATAMMHLDDLVRIAPGFAEAWNTRATIYFMQQRYGFAIHDIYRTLAIEPRHFGALAGLGLILDRIGESAWALDVYRRVLEIHPHLPGAREGLRSLETGVEGQGI